MTLDKNSNKQNGTRNSSLITGGGENSLRLVKVCAIKSEVLCATFIKPLALVVPCFPFHLLSH